MTTERPQLPLGFVNRIQNDHFIDTNLLDALEKVAPTSIRYNPSKNWSAPLAGKPIEYCTHAYRLSERPSFTDDPLFHAGVYYPQEAGSMVLDHVLRYIDLPDAPKVLDACAAPGGKSTLILSHLNGKGLLVANEVVNQRSKILKENVTKWGASNVVVSNNDPSDFNRLPSFFDIAFVDAPCSGEGMFRRLPHSRTEWSEDNVAHCAARQRRILHDLSACIAPGGYLVYSTCTLNELENEANVRQFCDENGWETVQIAPVAGLKPDRNGTGYYCFPHLMETEGFYFAVLQKPMSEHRSSKGKFNTDFTKVKPDVSVSEHVNLENHVVYGWMDQLLALPHTFEEEMRLLQKALKIVKMGCNVGSMARKGFVPSVDLALAPQLLSTENRIEVDLAAAISFLKLEMNKVDGPKGFQIIQFENNTLGWVKNIGNRVNVYWPKEWRIRK